MAFSHVGLKARKLKALKDVQSGGAALSTADNLNFYRLSTQFASLVPSYLIEKQITRKTKHMKKQSQVRGAAKTQIKLAHQNETTVLIAIAKFGWLSQSQLATCCGLSISSMRHIIRRMITDKLIWPEVYRDSPSVKAYALTRKGALRLKDNKRCQHFDKITSFYSSKGFLSHFEHQYHRHLANEFLVNLQADKIQIGSNVISHVKPEHEIQALKGMASTIFQCVPDALVLTDDMTLIAIEIENSSRGLSQHKGSLTHWLSVLAEKYERQGHYSDSLRSLFSELLQHDEDGYTVYPDFLNVEQVFVCRTEAIFRNIWRKVERATNQYPLIRENICYFVLPEKQRWHNIFDGVEALFHEEPETIERVKSGAYRYTFSPENRELIVEESCSGKFSRKTVSKRYGISVSTLDRWKRGFR
jgi:DNA-binding MarR family transcriptional regulator